MNRKMLGFIAFSLFYSVSVFAGGKVETRTAETPESWNEDFDVSAKKKGKYNVIVTAEDLAGNVGVSGPFNMYIDPRSDLPVVQINHPIKYMNVTGNLNISGICFDDDEVDYVEVSIDDGEPVRAKGRQFWSSFFDMGGLEEGEHTVQAWGVDINGVIGAPISVPFQLNTHTPQTTITNIEPGTLISGKKVFEGVVKDGNGVSKLFYSLDSGKTYRPVRLKHRKKENISTFSIDMDTTLMPDGPSIYWFKAVDRLGTEGVSTVLFFIDNSPPAIDFSYPPDGEPQGSRFAIGGSASDLVSLEALAWKMGKESGVFELVKGNPYWVKEFDVSASPNSSQTIEIIAKDTAGNVTMVKRTILIDKQKDIPHVNLVSPIANMLTENSVYVAGFVDSAYGVSEVRYILDRNKEVAVPVADGPFGINIENISAGKHTLSVYGVNASGVKGPAQTVDFSAMGKQPVITVGKGDSVVYTLAGSSSSFTIRVVAEAGLKSVDYSIGDDIQETASIKKGSKSVAVNVPYSGVFTEPVTAIEVTALDIFDREVHQTVLVSSAEKGAESFRWAPAEKTDGGVIVLADGAALSGVYRSSEESSAAVESVAVSGKASSSFEVSFEGDVVTLLGKDDGVYKDVSLVITDTEGHSFTTGGVTIFVNHHGPKIRLDDSSDAPKVVREKSIMISGRVSSPLDINAVNYSVNQGEKFSISPKFDKEIPIGDLPDGLILVNITAVDAVGEKSVIHQLFYKDSTPPQVTMVLPKPEDKVNGSILAAFSADNFFNIKKAEYKPAGRNAQWQEMTVSPLIYTLIGTAENPISKDMEFRFTNYGGNVAVYSNYDFEIDRERDKPVLDVNVPVDNAIVFEDFDLSGIVYDDDGVSKLFYQIDNGNFVPIDIEDAFSIPFQLSQFSDNEHTISLYAEDIYGVKSNVLKRKIRVSMNIPEAKVVTPFVNEMLNEAIEITGTAKDKNGIAYVEVSVDNGNTYNRAKGRENWKYVFDTRIIDDGTHVVFVRTYDNYGQLSIISSLLNVDNTPPGVEFESPVSGGKYDNILPLSGSVYDAILLDNVIIKITGMNGQKVPSSLREMKLSNDMLVRKKIDISQLSEGGYNLEIIGYDRAKNKTIIARNFDVERSHAKNKIELMYPLDGEKIIGEFNIYGKINHTGYPETVDLYIDDEKYLTGEVSMTGYFNFNIPENELAKGSHRISVKGTVVSGKLDVSNINTVNCSVAGPWVTMDNFAMGDFAVERPYIRGRVGYVFSEKEQELLADKKTATELLRFVDEKAVKAVEISFNNGKSFEKTKLSKGKWKYRLETGDMAEGKHFILVRATMANSEVAVCRTVVKVDKTLPTVTLIKPKASGVYDDKIVYAGMASDNVMVKKVEMSLRKGDKYFYGVPKGLQGLHFDAGVLGATLWNVGVGLSFFDSKVKLQVHYGQMLRTSWDNLGDAKGVNKSVGIEQMRYGGHVFSAKILATVYELAFERFGGPDVSWLHLSAALGANFSIFTDTQSKRTQVLSAMVTQIEFPRIKLNPKKVKYFNKYAFYTEGQLWFIPTDVSGGSDVIKSVIPRIAFGLRAEVF